MLVLDKRSIPILEKTWRCPYQNETKMDWIQETEVVFTLVDAIIVYAKGIKEGLKVLAFYII